MKLENIVEPKLSAENSNGNINSQLSEPYLELAFAILRQAVIDMKYCRKQILKENTCTKKYRKALRNRQELMDFFKSDWCRTLCDYLDVNWDSLLSYVYTLAEDSL